MSALHGTTHWCAVMEPKLLRMLAAMAFTLSRWAVELSIMDCVNQVIATSKPCWTA